MIKKNQKVYLVRVRDTQGKPGHIARTWNEEGIAHANRVLENNILKV
jgi:hypothetical protein